MIRSIPTLEAIRKRKSERNFSKEPVSERTIMELLDAANRAPSGYNLQPWHFIVIKNPDIKNLLYYAAMSQQQVLDAPFVIAFISNSNAHKLPYKIVLSKSKEQGLLKADYADFLQKEVQKNFSIGFLSLSGFLKKILTPIKRLFGPVVSPCTSKSELSSYMYAHTMLCAATFMIAAEGAGLSTCPIEGFDEVRVKQLLAVPDNMKICVLIAVGYSNKELSDSNNKVSFRFPIKEKVSVDIFPNQLDKLTKS